MADYNIPRMPKHYGTLKMPEHDVERELTLLRQNWKDLPISAVVSEYGYACHASAWLTSGRERRLASWTAERHGR